MIYPTGIRIPHLLLMMVAVLVTAGCERGGDDEAAQNADTTVSSEEPAPTVSPAEEPQGTPPTVDLVVTDYAIEAPTELPAGWTNFRLTNQGAQTHFVVLYRMPEGKTIEDQKREVVPAFDEVMLALTEGEIGKEQIGDFLGARMPDWAFTWVYKSGPGLLAPGMTSETAVLLDEPGTYLLECYVKAPDGTWHTSMGMLEQLEVVAAETQPYEPETSANIILRTSGIEMNGALSPGRNVVRVEFADNPEGIMPFDVHLARLDDGVNKETIVQWMDWSNVEGLRAPAPVVFLGGAEQAPAGTVAYVTLDVEAGPHAWVSEINADQMYLEVMVE